jgi:hypothetical protein
MDRGRMLWGGALVALGAVLLAGQLGWADAGAVVAGWWPVVVVAAGLLRLLDRDTTGGVLLTAVGLALLGWRQGLLGAEAWQWLAPALLITLGVVLLLRRPRAAPAAASLAGVTRGTVGPHLDVAAVLAGRELRAQAEPFQGGSATAVLGSVELDLTPATLGPDGARLELTAMLGSVELQVPDDWRVRIEGPAILGGIEDRTHPGPEGAPLLVVRAFALLGAVEVTSRVVRRPPPAPGSGPAGPTRPTDPIHLSDPAHPTEPTGRTG